MSPTRVLDTLGFSKDGRSPRTRVDSADLET
jgi:hypothetical protein